MWKRKRFRTQTQFVQLKGLKWFAGFEEYLKYAKENFKVILVSVVPMGCLMSWVGMQLPVRPGSQEFPNVTVYA